jgi:hypothetical protein
MEQTLSPPSITPRLPHPELVTAELWGEPDISVPGSSYAGDCVALCVGLAGNGPRLLCSTPPIPGPSTSPLLFFLSYFTLCNISEDDSSVGANWCSVLPLQPCPHI